jgi:hypothetical protein
MFCISDGKVRSYERGSIVPGYSASAFLLRLDGLWSRCGETLLGA